MADDFQSILKRGIEAARSGRRDVARTLLAEAIRLNPRSEAAWLWMSGVVRSREERIQCLQQVLKINPSNETALRGLRSLGAAADQRRPAVQPEPAPPATVPEDLDPVPRPDPSAIERAKQEADQLLQNAEEPDGLVVWQRGAKRSSSAAVQSEAEKVQRLPLPRFNPIVIIVGLGGFALIAGLVLVLLVVRSSRNQQIAEQTTSAPTLPPPTLTLTPTQTVTPLPTRTPLPEYLAQTIEPTVTLGSAPRGNIEIGVTPSPPYGATPHGSSPLTRATEAFYAGDYETALELVLSAREQGETSVDSYYLEAASLLQLGERDAAVEAVEAGLAQGDAYAPLHILRGDLLAEEGAFEQARSEYEQAQLIDPNYLPAYLNLAQLYAARGDLTAAFEEIAQARATNRYTYNVNLIGTEVDLNLQQGDTQRALALAKLAYYIDPGSEEVNLRLARARLERSLYETAIVDLETYVTEVFPSSAESWALLGQAYQAAGRPTDALQAYQRALQLDGDTIEAYLGRGLFYTERGDFEQALADLDRVIAARPADAGARRARAEANADQGNLQQALADLETLFEIQTGREAVALLTDTEAAFDLDLAIFFVELYAESATATEVITLTTALLERDLTDVQRATLLELRAKANLEAENLQAARTDIDSALALEETGSRRFIRGLILEAQGSLEEAQREYEWVLFWDTVYGYDFADEARERRDDVIDAIEEQEATP